MAKQREAVRSGGARAAAGEFGSVVLSWALRLLLKANGIRGFVSGHGFSDDDLARALGLDAFIEPEGEFDRDAVLAKIRRLYCAARRDLGLGDLPAVLRQNLGLVQREFGLDDAEALILGFCILAETQQPLRQAFELAPKSSPRHVFQVVAIALNIPADRVRKALSPGSSLSDSGLLAVELESVVSFSGGFSFLHSGMPALMAEHPIGLEDLIRHRVAKAPDPQLTIADFPYLCDQLDLTISILRHALRCGTAGVNLLVYGAPGTGKTQLARVIAHALGCPAYDVTTEDMEGEPIDAVQRLIAHRLSQKLFKQQDVIFVFDEAEDVFDDGGLMFGRKSTAQTRKGWLNKTLESNRTPTIWLSNSVSCMDPAFIRRFSMVIEVPLPPVAVRRQIIRKACGAIADDSLEARLASHDKLSPAIIAHASAIVSGIAGELGPARASEAVERLIDNTLRAQGDATILKGRSQGLLQQVYDPAFVNADRDLGALADALGRARAGRVCLYGPPGTGKTAFGKWLAERLNAPLASHRVSDLASKWVGQSERNIARAFADAQRSGAVLLIDEVDSFLQDRRDLSQSWEKTTVNEMLTQIESYEGIFVASTNLMHGLDQAVLRRFDVKVRFDYLAAQQAMQLLQRHCAVLGLTSPDEQDGFRLRRLANVTPGDFATVSRQHALAPFATVAAYVSALEAECVLKELSPRPLGFV